MLSRIPTLLTLLALALALAGCKTDEEKMISIMLDQKKRTAEILKGVTDEASAKDAAQKLTDLGKDVRDRLKAFESKVKGKTPDDAAIKAAVTKYQSDIEKAERAIQDEKSRIFRLDGKIMMTISQALFQLP